MLAGLEMFKAWVLSHRSKKLEVTSSDNFFEVNVKKRIVRDSFLTVHRGNSSRDFCYSERSVLKDLHGGSYSTASRVFKRKKRFQVRGPRSFLL